MNHLNGIVGKSSKNQLFMNSLSIEKVQKPTLPLIKTYWMKKFDWPKFFSILLNEKIFSKNFIQTTKFSNIYIYTAVSEID